MASELWVSRVDGRGVAALATDGRVEELDLEEDHDVRPGAIFLGRVGRHLPDQGVFVDVGGGVDAFLRSRAEGTPLVQVRRAATAGKGPRVSRDLVLAGRLAVFRPGSGQTTPRTAAQGVPPERVEAEVEGLRRRWQRLQERAAASTAPALIEAAPPFPVGVVRDLPPGVSRIVVEEPGWRERIVTAFGEVDPELGGRIEVGAEPRVADALRRALDPRVELRSGGFLLIEHTAACVTIDVNSGAGSRSEANLEAAGAIPAEIRLRRLAGTIVVDFIGREEPTVWKQVVERLEAGCRRRRCRARVAAIGAGGLVQLRRRRERGPLDEQGLSPSAS